MICSFKNYLSEAEEPGGGLTVFDIDSTLFNTTARVLIKKDGKTLKKLEQNTSGDYKLKPGEEFDHSEFRSASKFKNESTPIDKILDKAKAILLNTINKPNSKVIIVTARSDMDDKEVFLDKFRDHGFDIDRVRIEQAGKIKEGLSVPIKKRIIIYNYLKTGQFSRVRLFDDCMKNIKEFLKLRVDFPEIKFAAFLVNKNGSTTSINV